MTKIKPGALIEIIGAFETTSTASGKTNLSCFCWNETKQRISFLRDKKVGIYLGIDTKANDALRYPLKVKVLVDKTIYVIYSEDFKVLENDK